MTGPLIFGREEPFQRDCRLEVARIGLAGERGNGDRPRFALAASLGLVG